MAKGIYKRIQGKKYGMSNKKHSIESKLKMSKGHIGLKHNKITIEKIRQTSTGRIHSEETKLKQSLSNIGKNNPMYGKTTSIKQKEAARKNMIGNKYRKGLTSPMKGKKHTKKTIKKICLTKLIRGSTKKGEEHYRWIKDRNNLKRDVGSEERRSSIYKNWRRLICNIDNWKCKINNKDCNGRLEVHHILGWVDYPELRYNINNGITLCHAHHPRKRAEEKRLSPYFMELVLVSKI